MMSKILICVQPFEGTDDVESRMKERKLIPYILLITNLNLNIVCSDLKVDDFLEEADKIISSKIVSSSQKKEEIVDEKDTLPLLDFNLKTSKSQSSRPLESQQFVDDLPANNVKSLNKFRKSNDEYFLEVLKTFANSGFTQKNETCLTTPRKIKFLRTRDDGSVLGRGGLAEHNSLQFPVPSQVANELNILASNSHIDIPILPEDPVQKFKLLLKGRRPAKITSPLRHQIHNKLPNHVGQSSSIHRAVGRYERGHWPFSPPTQTENFSNPYQPQNPNGMSHSFKTPIYGSYGDYSWTIEKGSPELLDSESILPAKDIFEVISQAEKEETNVKEQLKQQQLLSNYYNHQRKDTFVNHRGEENPLQQHYEAWSHLTPTYNFKDQDTSGHRDRYDSYVPHHYNDYDNSPHLSHYEYVSYDTPPSVTSSTYDKPYGLPVSQSYVSAPPLIPGPSYPLHGHPMASGLGHGGSGMQGDGQSQWGSIDGWMSKVKSLFHKVSTGNYSPDRSTRKVLEASIGALAFLAFGGYIAALIFQAFIPSIAFPLFPGFFNVNVTNPGLFGLLFGRSSNGRPNVYVIKESEIHHLNQRVKRALHVQEVRLMRLNQKIIN